jgi:predicted helicase
VEAYQEQEPEHNSLVCEAAHVDGSMNASQKEAKLTWLKAETESNICRILSNVRCLSEGVDVPALDAVLFLTPRNSQVDVVQSVGRVMRNAPNKKLGYVILPVVIPSGMSPEEALNDNKTYKVVWEVLQALRSHDDRFDAMINKLDLIGKTNGKMEVISITDKIQPKQDKGTKKKDTGKGQYGIGEKPKSYDVEGQLKNQAGLEFEVGEIERALYAKVVKKCGNRNHWGDWASDIAKIANTHITRITTIVQNPANTKEQQAFKEFAKELRDDLNDSITDAEVIEMLAQHLITKPVFDALFSTYNFTDHNPMSKAMQGVLDILQEHRLDKEADTLEKFYASVKMRAEGIDNAQGKQKIVVELYDKFFRNAFPKMTQRLGIVYTPVEVVDFILHSVNHLLQQEFGQTLGSKGVHIIDPFTGTGTFITRLIQSGLIKSDELTHKYKHEIHANELVLLAYYIAAINIEAAYHGEVIDEYAPFEGICLTDTFQMYEKDDLVDELLVDNSARRIRQKSLEIRVIVGNPPYSEGQKSENDNNANLGYPKLDSQIRSTYARQSTATLSKGLYNSYIRAIRWASDRLGESGVIGFVTNAGFLESRFADGIRKCLAEEFSNIYIFHLRGLRGKHTSGERAKQEGGQIFGMGSGAAICIFFLVKNTDSTGRGNIYFHSVEEYLDRDQKLAKLTELQDISGIAAANAWTKISPDSYGDWLKQREDTFNKFVLLGDKKIDSPKLFHSYSQGILTARDTWCFNGSNKKVVKNMSAMIDFYNSEVLRFHENFKGLDQKARGAHVDSFIDSNPEKISWTRALKQDLAKGKQFSFRESGMRECLYRPFTKQWIYFDRRFNEMVYQMPRIFPNAADYNLMICVSGPGCITGFSAIMSKVPVEFCIAAMKGGSQCFPLYLYDELVENPDQGGLFVTEIPARRQRDAITDDGLAHFQLAYPDEQFSKEDLFYYVYGILHSADYRERFADNLSKELPRIPAVKKAADFWAFSKAGRDLAELHLHYETVDCYPLTLDTGKKKLAELDDKDYYVTKMKFAKKREKHTVIYNHQITIRDIPEEAFDYVVNGKAALDWVMERQAVKPDPASGIVNDANDWAIETMGNAKYPLELFQRVITVSLETMKIVNALPKLDI